jgi:hypothetical protein
MQRRRGILNSAIALLAMVAPQLMLICALNTPAVAAVCCPSGCVPSGYAGGCWQIGTNNSCPAISCPGSSSGGGSGGGGQGGGGIVYSPPPPPPCPYLTSQVGALAKQCEKDLSANAQLWGCLFEDDAGRAEDRRTGLTCAERQAALAKQCQARCDNWAANRRTCTDPNSDWQTAFADIGGVFYGSARVDLCGPRLPSGKVRRVPGGRVPLAPRPF